MNSRVGIRLSERQRLDWLRLSRTEGVGPRTFQGLINRYGGAGAALEALPGLARVRGRTVFIPHPDAIAREAEAAARLGVRLIASGEEDYPAALMEIDAPPPILAVRGSLGLIHRPAIAIVGARNASAAGRRMAGKLAGGLAEAGYAVVSGLARGIDTDVHRASLAAGTIAVLAGGLDRPYPPENEPLLGEIVEKGAAVSEMPLGLSPRGRDFPRRNRLISGLSLGVVVVEAARRSGSLITARMAGEQGREVFAVPGSPLDPRCEGTNDLLKAGAMVVTSVEDIVTVLRPLAGEAPRAPRLFREPPAEETATLYQEWEDDSDGAGVPAGRHAPEDGETADETDPDMSDANRLLALMSVDPVEIDLLSRMSGLDMRAVQAALIDLELAGQLIRHGGNRVGRAV